MDEIKQKAIAAGVPCGVHIVQPSKEELQIKIEEGYRFIAYSIDAVFFDKHVERPFL